MALRMRITSRHCFRIVSGLPKCCDEPIERFSTGFLDLDHPYVHATLLPAGTQRIYDPGWPRAYRGFGGEVPTNGLSGFWPCLLFHFAGLPIAHSPPF